MRSIYSGGFTRIVEVTSGIADENNRTTMGG